MVGYPSLDVVSKSVLFGVVSLGLSADGVLLGFCLGSIKLAYSCAFEESYSLEKDLYPSVILGAGFGLAAGPIFAGIEMLCPSCDDL